MINQDRLHILDTDHVSIAPRGGSAALTLEKIAAIVLASDGILLSRNLRDFRDISNFDVQDWTM